MGDLFLVKRLPTDKGWTGGSIASRGWGWVVVVRRAKANLMGIKRYPWVPINAFRSSQSGDDASPWSVHDRIMIALYCVIVACLYCSCFMTHFGLLLSRYDYSWFLFVWWLMTPFMTHYWSILIVCQTHSFQRYSLSLSSLFYFWFHSRILTKLQMVCAHYLP